MPDTLCRVAVEVTGADQSGTVDLVLPSQCPLGELMPSLVDTIFGDTAEPQRWYLTKAAGPPLDSSISLRDNQIQDGDLVVLASAPLPRPRLTPTEPCAVVALNAGQVGQPLRRGVVLTAAVAGTVLVAAALIWSGLVSGSAWHLWSAGAVSAAAATAALALGRTDRDSALVSSTGAVVFATATGILAAPGAGWAATSLLAAASTMAMATLLARMTSEDGVLTAFAAAAGAVSAAAAICVIATSRLDVAGTALAVISLTALSAAPRIASIAAGVGPTRYAVDARRAAAAHHTMTGLVAGWSASAMLGSVAVTAGSLRPGSSPMLAAGFCADLGLLLILRQRSHVAGGRRIWLVATGFVALFSALIVTVTAAPAQGYWVCGAAAVGCAACVRWTDRSGEPNPMVRHGIQVIEYVALVAVVPLAFWVSGLYGFVRELSLS